MEFLLAACMGIGLAAACGFRIFVPMLVACIALRSGHVGVAASHSWLASDAALVLFITQMSPMLNWSLALIAGGGAAAVAQGATVVVRGASTAITGGVVNPVVSTGELIVSTILSILAMLLPILIGVLVLALVGYLAYRLLRRRPAAAPQPA